MNSGYAKSAEPDFNSTDCQIGSVTCQIGSIAGSPKPARARKRSFSGAFDDSIPTALPLLVARSH